MNKSLSPDNIRVLLLEGLHENAVQTLESAGYTNIDYQTTGLSAEELVAIIPDYHMIGIRSRTQLTPRVLDAAERLMAIGCYCIGTNQVDKQHAKSRGIPVFNAPYSNTRSVAEWTICCMISLFRGISTKNIAAHRGDWQKTAKGSHEIRGKTLGIIGYGNIGQQVSILAESLGMTVIYYDVDIKLPLGNATAVTSLNQLLSESDVVTLHVPETPQTQNLIDYAQLRLMKQGAFLLNAARGTVLNVEALTELLATEHLAGAAVDVFPTEPKGNGEDFSTPLQGMDNVILTPHIGGSTQEAQADIGTFVSRRLLDFSNIGSTAGSVNMPQVDLPRQSGENHRFLHMHENKPGVLSGINAVLQKYNVNIAGQYLQTDTDIGYVVTDIERLKMDDTQALCRDLAAVDGTIRTRILYISTYGLPNTTTPVQY